MTLILPSFAAVMEDKMIIEDAEAVIADTHVDAVTPLLAARLIDEASVEAVAAVLAENWVTRFTSE